MPRKPSKLDLSIELLIQFWKLHFDFHDNLIGFAGDPKITKKLDSALRDLVNLRNVVVEISELSPTFWIFLKRLQAACG
jgi:hypothetical protein